MHQSVHPCLGGIPIDQVPTLIIITLTINIPKSLMLKTASPVRLILGKRSVSHSSDFVLMCSSIEAIIIIARLSSVQRTSSSNLNEHFTFGLASKFFLSKLYVWKFSSTSFFRERYYLNWSRWEIIVIICAAFVLFPLMFWNRNEFPFLMCLGMSVELHLAWFNDDFVAVIINIHIKLKMEGNNMNSTLIVRSTQLWWQS